MAPLTGKFAADFDAFYAAVSKAEVSLKNFETGAGRVGTSLDAMGNKLAGTRMIQDATLMARAVEDIGGVSRLTEGELARLSAQAKEAAAKLVAMGREVPPGIQKIADATKTAHSAAVDWKSALLNIAGAVGVGFSVGAIVGFVGKVVDGAGHVADLAAQLSVSTDAIQKWDYAIQLSGGTINDVEKALGVMNQKLGAGDTGTKQALEDVGLSFNAVRQMKPEDAFNTIVTAVAAIEDPMKRAALQNELFGKGGKAMLAAMANDFVATGEKASLWSKQQIQELDDAGDAWTSMLNTVTVVSGKFIAQIAGILNAWKSQGEADYAQQWFTRLHLNTADATRDLKELGNWITTITGREIKLPDVPKPKVAAGAGVDMPKFDVAALLAIGDGLDKVREKTNAATKVANTHGEAVKAMFEKYSGVTATKALKDLGAVFDQMGGSTKLTAKQLEVFRAEAMKLSADGGTMTQSLWDMVRASGALTVPISTADLNIKALGESVAVVAPKLDAWAVAANKLAAMPPVTFGVLAPLNDLGKSIDIVVPKAREATDVVGALATGFVALGQIGGSSFGPLMQAMGALFNNLKTGSSVFDTYKTSVVKAHGEAAGAAVKNFGIATPLFDSNAKAGEKWASGVASAGAVASGAMDVWAVTSAAATKSEAAMKGAMAGASAGAAFGPYGAAIGAVAGAVTGMIRAMSAGRRAVKDFAESFDTAAAGTGFDELHKQLLVLGEEGERMWIKLTQQTKKGDKKAADAMIAEIKDALANAPNALAAAAGYQTTAELQKIADKAKATYEYMVASGQYSAGELARAFEASSAAQAASIGISATAQKDAIDAITAKYADSISKLESEYKTLSDSVAGEAEEAEMGIVETKERARMKDIAAEKAAKEAQRDAEIAAETATYDAILASGVDVDKRLRELFGKPYVMGAPQWPGVPTPPAPAPPVPGGGGGGSNYEGGRDGSSYYRPRPSSSSAIVIQVVSQMDGREVGRGVAKVLPGLLQEAGR